MQSKVEMKVEKIMEMGLEKANEMNADVVIVDSAGRSQLDDKLMQELQNIQKVVEFQDVLLVLDAMTGQEALNIAQVFDNKLALTGFILTKMDSDARGGAAVSVRAITEKPIKLVGVGEKIEDLEDFYPDRVASKILGMGDVLSLVEKMQKKFKGESLEAMEQRMRNNQFTLMDFEIQLKQIGKMGSLKGMLGMLPGIQVPAEVDEKPMQKFNYILSSMTKAEKMNPSLLNGSRRQRIAKGSGSEVSDINQLLKRFNTMSKMMKKFSKTSPKNMMKEMQKMMGAGSLDIPLQ